MASVVNSPVRVCLVTGEYPPMQGGVGDFTRELARALVAHGAQVAIICDRRGKDQGDGFPVYPLIARWDWSAQGQVLARAQMLGAHVVNIQYQTGAYGMHPAINLLPWRMRQTAQRSIFTYHDLLVPYLFPKAGPLRTWVTRAPARWADGIIVTTDEDWLAVQGWHPRALVDLIPIGSNIPVAFPPAYNRAIWRARLGVAPQEWLLCYFGFVRAAKGAEDLIQALEFLVRGGYPAHLVMIGGQTGDNDPTQGADLRRVQAMIAEYHLRDYVHWTDFVGQEEVSAYLTASDVAVLPYRDGASYRRGSLMAVLAHGLPIVTTEPHPSMVSGILPRLENGRNAVLVPRGDPIALAQGVVRIMNDARLAARLRQGAQAVAAAFTWDSIAQRTLAFYQRVLGTTVSYPHAHPEWTV